MTNPAVKEELASNVEESQLKFPKPKMSIIREALNSVINIVEGTTWKPCGYWHPGKGDNVTVIIGILIS
ncbi:hypothetical protein [Peribacillus deserti]|uniref:Uncharacterized protein n=1 Tax=Peribacillus deserti TaxID=673318 RepID=A0A2N5M1D2_9BACI|nr:hypothetical protein [Peribacillus deserti]PLT28160.1 hypothetical protein CUU66_19635 [Peribacillus deserti]